MKINIKHIWTGILCALITVNTIEPARLAQEISPEPKQTTPVWLRILERLSPHLSEKQKARLTTLRKHTGQLVAAFLILLALGYGRKKWIERTRKAPITQPAKVAPFTPQAEEVIQEEPGMLEEETYTPTPFNPEQELLKQLRPSKRPSVQERASSIQKQIKRLQRMQNVSDGD